MDNTKDLIENSKKVTLTIQQLIVINYFI